MKEDQQVSKKKKKISKNSQKVIKVQITGNL